MENKLNWTLLFPQKVGAKVEMSTYFKNVLKELKFYKGHLKNL